jgi:parvulin-like peptidyl-prolyl isomerase
MVVVKTKEEADALKAKIEAGEMTMYQAAAEHSIAAKAKEDLGEVGWVNQGTTVPALDQVIFALGPGDIGGPVQTPAGWHLVTVQDVQDAKYTDFDDADTRKLTRRRFLDEKLNEYAVELRKNEFPVVVYEDRLVKLAQQEADMVKELAAKAQEPGSVTEKRLEDLQKYLGK